MVEEIKVGETEKQRDWEIRIEKGILTCTINMTVPNGIDLACGVADRIKAMVMGLEAKAQMEREMAKRMSGVINPSVAYPGRSH